MSSGIFGSILIPVILLVGFLYVLYVQLIKKRNRALEALSGIDVQLIKRHDIIPNVLTIAKKFMEHERGLLEEITKLRAQASAGAGEKKLEGLPQRLQAEKMLQDRMGQFFLAVENYPDLKSDQTMLQAQRTYNEVEEHISASRRFYNAAVRELNDAVQIFPSSLVAAMIGIAQMPFLEATEEQKAPVSAADIL